MKRLKPLFKLELPTILVASCYFSLIEIFLILNLKNNLNTLWATYLIAGIRNFRYYLNETGLYGNYFFPNIRLCILLHFIGLCLLSYASFKSTKSHDQGRFLKSLPYTEVQRCFVRMTLTIVSYTFLFTCYGLFLLKLRSQTICKFSELMPATSYAALFQKYTVSSLLIHYLLTAYLTSLLLYLLLILIQYLVSSNLGSILVTLHVLSTPFLLAFCTIYLFDVPKIKNIIVKFLFMIINLLGLAYTAIFIQSPITPDCSEESSYATLHNTSLRYLALLFLIISLLICIHLLCKHYAQEKRDLFIPYKPLNILYTLFLSTTISLLIGCLAHILLKNIILPVHTSLLTYTSLALGEIIGLLLSIRLTHPSQKKKEAH